MYKKTISDENVREKFEIALLSANYLNSKRIIREYEEDIIDLSADRLEIHHRIVHHIEYVVSILDDKEKLIIENEVLRGKKGKWYTGMMTSPSYYRYQRKAYKNFLRCL